MPSWLFSASTERYSWVKKCRGAFVCVCGCEIPTGSSYLRLDAMAGGGCGSSIVELAICMKHSEEVGLVPFESSPDAEDLLPRLGFRV